MSWLTDNNIVQDNLFVETDTAQQTRRYRLPAINLDLDYTIEMFGSEDVYTVTRANSTEIMNIPVETANPRHPEARYAQTGTITNGNIFSSQTHRGSSDEELATLRRRDSPSFVDPFFPSQFRNQDRMMPQDHRRLPSNDDPRYVPGIGDVRLTAEHRSETVYSVAEDPYLTYGSISYDTNQRNRERNMAWNTATVTNPERIEREQLNRHLPRDLFPPNAKTPSTSRTFPSTSLPSELNPTNTSSSVESASTTLSLVTHPDGSCNYKSPEGICCNHQQAIPQNRAMARHWVTSHALVELERMTTETNEGSLRRRQKRSKRKKSNIPVQSLKPKQLCDIPLAWAKGTIINSESRIRAAEKYLSPCPECARLGMPIRNRFKREDTLKEHLEDIHDMEENKAFQAAKDALHVSELGPKRWEEAIRRILC
ncbi:hypothetical protein K439DRAFT_1160147 [Ramaria rubella]|nr:hypothetical protein K439DRAFT_1160147 [Ramaria rubella]